MIQNSRISIIVAMDEKRGIGKENKLMWRIPGELPRFKQITMGHPIIMGRKTYESIGRVLPGRTNIIITRDLNYKGEGAIVVHSLSDAFIKAQHSEGSTEVFVIGGGQVFSEALPVVDRLYLTLVEGDFGADTFFPEYSGFNREIENEFHSDSMYRYRFVTLERSGI
jgi:dihydrofolate reductase